MIFQIIFDIEGIYFVFNEIEENILSYFKMERKKYSEFYERKEVSGFV